MCRYIGVTFRWICKARYLVCSFSLVTVVEKGAFASLSLLSYILNVAVTWRYGLVDML